MVDNEAFSNESLNQLYGAIRQLSEIDRGVILLYLEEKSYQEIAEITGVSEKSVSRDIEKIRTILIKFLKIEPSDKNLSVLMLFLYHRL